jgi:hypothetical protein
MAAYIDVVHVVHLHPQAAARMLAVRGLSDEEVDQLLARDGQEHDISGATGSQEAPSAPCKPRLLDDQQCAPLIAAM